MRSEHSGLASHASGASSGIADTVAAVGLQSRFTVSAAAEPAERWERGHIQPGCATAAVPDLSDSSDH